MSRDLKSFKKPTRVLNTKNINDVVLLFKAIFRYRNCFLSSVAIDGKNVD